MEENEHSLGLRMVSDAFELSGWSTHYLGANVPVDALQAHIERWRPDLVGLSVALIQHLPRLRATVTMLRNGFPAERPTILVGGLATNMIEEAFRWVGADLWCADAERARQLAIEKATNHLPDLP